MGQAAGRLVRRRQLYHHGLVNAKQLSHRFARENIRKLVWTRGYNLANGSLGDLLGDNEIAVCRKHLNEPLTAVSEIFVLCKLTIGIKKDTTE